MPTIDPRQPQCDEEELNHMMQFATSHDGGLPPGLVSFNLRNVLVCLRPRVQSPSEKEVDEAARTE